MSFLLVTACLVIVLFMNMMTRTYIVFHLLRVFTAIFMNAIECRRCFFIRREIICPSSVIKLRVPSNYDACEESIINIHFINFLKVFYF